MQVDEIRRLVKLVEESDIDELEVRRWWQVVRILKRGRNHKGEAAQLAAPAPVAPAVTPAPPSSQPAAASPASTVAEPASAPPGPATSPILVKGEVAAVEDGLVTIRSPMVGTFYRAPNPTAPPYAEEGARIEVGQVVCIVEAMKLMNEIESEVAGRVEKVLVENGKPVEFNQPLFLIRPE